MGGIFQMEFLLFSGSVIISCVLILVFRHLDRNNRSFDKMAKLSKSVKDEISSITKDKIQEVRDYNNFIETSLQRGKILLDDLNKNLKLTEQKSNLLQNDKVLSLLSKVESIEKTFEDINHQLVELNETKNFSKNSNKFIRETMSEMKVIKGDIGLLKKELDNKRGEVTDVIKKQEERVLGEIEKNRKGALETLNKEKKYFDNNIETYKKEIENINLLITTMKDGFIKSVEDEFDTINQNYKLKSDTIKKEYGDIELDLKKKLEEKIGDYSKYIVRIEERGENLGKKIEKDLNDIKENYILDIKEGYNRVLDDLNKYNEKLRLQTKNDIVNNYSSYEEKYKKLIENIKNAEDNASSKLLIYEDFMKSSFDKFEKFKGDTFSEIKSKAEEFNIHINNAKDLGIRLELEIFNEIKANLNDFRNTTAGNLEAIKIELNNSIKTYEDGIEKRYISITNKTGEAERNITGLNDKFNDNIKDYESVLSKLETDKNYLKEYFNAAIVDLKGELNNQINNINSFYKNNEVKVKDDFDKVVSELDKLRERHKSNTIDDMEKYKNIFNNNMVKMKQYFEKETEKVFANIDKMVSDISNKADGKTDELTQRFEIKYREVETKLLNVSEKMEEKSHQLEDNIQNQSNAIEETLNEKMKSVMERLYEKQDIFEKDVRDIGINYELKLKSFTDEINSIIEDGDKKANEKIVSINSKINDFKITFDEFISETDKKIKIGEANYEKFVSELYNKTAFIEEDFENKTANIEKAYFNKGNELLKSNDEKLSLFIDKFDSLTESIEDIKTNIDKDITDKIATGKNLISDLLQKGANDIAMNYKSLEDETIAKIDEYKNELIKLKQNMKFLDEKFAKRFDDKLSDFDNKFNNRIQIYNEKYKTNIDEMYEKSKILEEKLSIKVAEIEDNYYKKGEDLVNQNKISLNEFVDRFKNLNREILELKSKIDSEVAGKIEDGKKNLDDQYKSLEGETIRKINDYKNELLKIRQNMQQLDEKFITRFNEKVNEVDSRFEQKIGEIDKKFDDEKFELGKKSEAMLNESRSMLENFKSDFNNLQSEITTLKAHIDGEVAKKIEDSKVEFNVIYQQEIVKLQEKYKSNEEMVINKLNDYKKDVYRIEQNMKQVDDRFTARFLEHSSILDKKIALIEDNIKKFEKSTGIFEKFDYMKDKLVEELQTLKDSLNTVKKERADVVEIEKRMVNIQSVVKENDQKFNIFLGDKKKIDNLSQTINNLKEVADSVNEKIASIDNAKGIIDSLDNKITLVERKLNSLETVYENATEKENEIRKSVESINDVKNRSMELSKYLEVINKKYDDLEFKRNTFEKVFKNFEKDANLITKSEGKVNDVIEKFNQMDGLIEDLEQRTDSINRIREWLVKAETQIENLNQETDKRIRLLESLFEKVPQSKIVKEKIKDEGNKKETVAQLRSQGWTIDDIAKTLDLSVGEVEFILDLEFHKVGK